MKKLIIKYLTSSLTENEDLKLRKWLENPENKKVFLEFLKSNSELNFGLINPNSKKAFNSIQSKIDNKNKPVFQLFNKWYRYAAIILLFISCGYLIQQHFFPISGNLSEDIKTINTITLEFENGEIKELDNNNQQQFINSKGEVVSVQNRNNLSYKTGLTSGELEFNTLTIPYGQTFKLILADNTVVNLNAGSSIKFPVKFPAKGDRMVYLNGEAFFDVSKDKTHPFIVNVDDINIEVLGTKFNITAYPEDIHSDVVLVEGSVQLYDNENKNSPTLLSPGEKGTYTNNGNVAFEVSEVNTELYTAWMQGKMVFRNMSFKNIAKKLERQYNVKIEVTNKQLENQIINASFEKENLNNILEYFKDIYELNYKTTNNTIYIN